MQLVITPDLKVIYIERPGAIRMYYPDIKKTKLIATLDVYFGSEDGLLGIALDPKFITNHWIYFFYSPANKKAVTLPKPEYEMSAQRVSRFTMLKDSILMSSERIILQIPLIRACCHSAGSLEFGPDGNLFISVGDNTNPSASSGFAPIDERSGRVSYDAQKSAANTNDLRGKILRIRPTEAGKYTVPEGNLFPQDGSKGRPEIYVMGNRNPYRISIDRKTGFLYWGEIGPDAGVDSVQRGPRGYDEINQAKKPGNYGWPYFVGNNIPYVEYNFATNASGSAFNPDAPVNRSVNNTGSKILPPAQPAFIWYPYADSPEFPVVGKGGRTSMAGPVYYRDLFKKAIHIFPAYYDGNLFIYDWSRNWIMVVKMDEQGRLKKIQPFLPSTKFSKPVDMEFGPDGALYVLEYGNFWKSINDDARLIKIQFYENNRKPVARASADKTAGATPLPVNLSAAGSFDFDKGDQLSYQWKLKDGSLLGSSRVLKHTFTKPGIYQLMLKVTDSHGEFAETSLQIKAGNEPPLISIETNANRSFYWNDQEFTYRVKVTDKEDGAIASKANYANAVKVNFDYLPEGKDLALLSPVNSNTGVNVTGTNIIGQRLLGESDCKTCHAPDKRTVGPGFMEIATRYKGKNMQQMLVNKVRNGGSGNWGEVPMAAHPQVSKDDIAKMVDYILALSKPAKISLSLSGTLKTPKQSGKESVYYLTANYTDKGANGIKPITSKEALVLRNATVSANDYDTSYLIMNKKAENTVRFTKNGSYIGFNNIDLTHIAKLTVKANSNDLVGTVEIRLNSEDGKMIGSRLIDQTKKSGDFDFLIEPVKGFHKIYFVYKTTDSKIGIWIAFDIASISFSK